MPPTLPYHYALSELFVAVTGLMGAWLLYKKNNLAALALLPFGLAGLVGALQIAGNLGSSIVALHQLLSRSGAVFGLTCMLFALDRQRLNIALIASLILAASSALVPSLVIPVSTLLLLGVTASTFGRSASPAYADAAGFLLLLPAQLIAATLRPSHPEIAWHLFHTLVGLWLLMVQKAFLSKGAPPPEFWDSADDIPAKKRRSSAS